MLTAGNRLLWSEMFAAVFAYSIVVFSYRENLSMICQASGVLFIAVFLYETMFKAERFRFVVPMPLICYFGFILYSFVSLIRTGQSFGFVSTELQLFLIAVALVNMILYQGSVRSIAVGFIAALLTAAYDLWNRLGGLAVRNEGDRIGSFVNNANVYAIALFIGIVLCLEYLLRPQEAPRPRFAAVYKLVCVLCLLLFAYEIIFLTGSRKAMISVFLLGFLFLLKLLFKVKFLSKISIMVLGTGMLAGLYAMMRESVFFERLVRSFDMLSGKGSAEESLTERSDMIRDGLHLWQQKPLFGWGTDQFRYVAGYQTYSHNNYVELLTNNGLIGLFLYYSMLAVLLFAGLRLLAAGDERQRNYGWLNVSILLILLFWDFALVSYYSKLQWVILSVITGLTYHAYGSPGSGVNPLPPRKHFLFVRQGVEGSHESSETQGLRA